MKIFTTTLLFLTLTISAFASQDKKTVKLRIQSQYGNLDETTVYFDHSISPAYEYQQDAQKVASDVPGVPVIYTITSDNIPCSINGFGELTNTETVSVGIVVNRPGNYSITATLLDNFAPTSIITLEDRLINRFIDLRTNFHTVYLDTTAMYPAEGRFFIHVTYPSSSSTTIAGCSNNDAQIQINTDPSRTWDSYQLFDALNNPVADSANVSSTVVFSGLAEGDYYLVRTYGAYTTTENFHINGNYIAASIGATAVQVATEENITFSANATHANHFEWDFGDGTLISGVAHPDLAFYEPGVYTVTLICSNDHGCSAQAQIQITVYQAVSGVKDVNAKDAAITSAGKNITVVLPEGSDNSTIQVYNLLGQPVFNSAVTQQRTTVSLDEPTGYYLVTVKNTDKVSTKRVFINR